MVIPTLRDAPADVEHASAVRCDEMVEDPEDTELSATILDFQQLIIAHPAR